MSFDRVPRGRENTHLLHEGKYHCMAALPFDWYGFKQTCESLYISTKTKEQTSQKGGQPYDLGQPRPLPLILFFLIFHTCNDQ